jgi:hypothetical protein
MDDWMTGDERLMMKDWWMIDEWKWKTEGGWLKTDDWKLETEDG